MLLPTEEALSLCFTTAEALDRAEGGEDKDAASLDEKAFLGEQVTAATEVPRRKRGEPSPGHKRRTKAEIAEDEARLVHSAEAVVPRNS